MSWPAVSGATSYVGAISTDARGTGDRTTTYVTLGNVTSWSPPADAGATLYYGVESVGGPSDGLWSSNEESIAWPASTPTTPTTPTPPPAPPAPPAGGSSGGMAVGVNVQDWGNVAEFGNSGNETVAQDVGSSFSYGRWDTGDSPSDFTGDYQQNGIKWDLDFSGPYSSGGVSALNPTSWAASAVSYFQTYCGGSTSVCPTIEVLNEPYGSWFWGSNADDQQNAVAYGQLVEDTYTAFHNAYGSNSPKILAYVFLGCSNGAAVGCSDSWSNWISAAYPNIGNYYDGNIDHAYGGAGVSSTLSAEGDRNAITSAYDATGKQQYITEIGWPTDVGAASTGDSEQWTQTQQADNIYNFVQWSRGTGYVAGIWYYAYFGDGNPGWYGLTTFGENGSTSGTHKPGWTALQEAANQQPCAVC